MRLRDPLGKSSTEDQPATSAHAQQLYTKLKDLDSSFKDLHLLVINQIEENEALEAEQTILDKHDDDIANLTIHLQCLTNSDSIRPTVTHECERRSLLLKISCLEKGLKATDKTI